MKVAVMEGLLESMVFVWRFSEVQPSCFPFVVVLFLCLPCNKKGKTKRVLKYSNPDFSS